MKRLIVYIILVAASLYIALIYRNEAFLNMFYGAAFVLLILAVLNIISISGMDVSINIPEKFVQSGREIPVRIVLNNKTMLPTGRIEIFVKSVNLYTGKKAVTKFYGSVDGCSSAVLECYYHTKNPGSIEFSIKKVKADDYFGILRFPVFRHEKYKHPVIVIPKLYKVPVFIVNGAYDSTQESRNTQNNFIAPDSMENGETRQYIPGDSFKNIHWKLSAKAGELMSKQKYSNTSCMAVFLICTGSIEGEYKRKCFLQAVLSISTGMVSNGCIHYICWPDKNNGTITRYIVRQESDSYYFVQEGMNIISCKNSPDVDVFLMKDMYIRKYNEQNNIPFIVINTNFELFVNDRKIIQYDFKDLKNSIGTTEILL